MVENTKIEWATHSFNSWVGCTKVSPGCDRCYAESWAKRTGHSALWSGERRRTTAANWLKPLAWNKRAAETGIREQVFCSSLSDVFDNQVPAEWRHDLWNLIMQTPHLDWLLLTKRPQNVSKMLPAWSSSEPWPNIWLGTTVENQEEADRRIPIFMEIPARVHFLSCEPMIGPIRFDRVPGFNRYNTNLYGWWVICGGESGFGARPMKPEWAYSLRDQCARAGVPFFMKQMSGPRKSLMPPIPDDLLVRQLPFFASLTGVST